MSDDDIDLTAEDALQVAQRALAKANDLAETNAELRDRIQTLEAKIGETSDFDDLDRDERVGAVREHLVTRAQSQGGRAALDYDDVMWEVFDGEPSRGYCYDLMRLAAQGQGFDYRDPSHDNQQVTVNLDALHDVAGFSRVNTSIPEGVE